MKISLRKRSANWAVTGIALASSRPSIYEEIPADFEAPPMDPAARGERADFVARRTSQGGAPTHFWDTGRWIYVAASSKIRILIELQ